MRFTGGAGTLLTPGVTHFIPDARAPVVLWPKSRAEAGIMTRKGYSIRQIARPAADADANGIVFSRCRQYLVLTAAGNELLVLVNPCAGAPLDPLLRGSALLDVMLNPGFPGHDRPGPRGNRDTDDRSN